MDRYSRKRLLALILCVCFIVVPTLSIVLIFTHASHGCTDDHCPVCAQIHNGQNLLKQLVMGMVAILFAFVCLSFDAATIRRSFSPIAIATPHTLKTRMNN